MDNSLKILVMLRKIWHALKKWVYKMQKFIFQFKKYFYKSRAGFFIILLNKAYKMTNVSVNYFV